MYLSMLELNPRSRQVQAELRDPYQMHRTFSRAFGDDPSAYVEARCLFRVDELKSSGKLTALLQSRVMPDWDRLPALGKYVASPPQVKAYAPQFSEGQVLRFRLRANPTVKRDGKRLGIYKESDQCAWLQRKAENGGFVVASVSTSSDEEQRCVTTDGFDTRFAVVVFDGTLRITDPVVFRQTLESGIGSAKGFGFGLLSIAPG